MSPPQRVLTAAASTAKSRRIRSARAVAAGSGIVVRFRRRGVRPQRHVLFKAYDRPTRALHLGSGWIDWPPVTLAAPVACRVRPLLVLWLHRPAATIGSRARRDRPGETREPW
jgi:hypothetical protein